MDTGTDFISKFFKALLAIGGIAVLLAFISALVAYFFDAKNVREESSHLSTGIGNALLVLHSFFEPGRKPQTEQVIHLRRRRTPVEREVRGLSELKYDMLHIRGYSRVKGKRYRMK